MSDMLIEKIDKNILSKYTKINELKLGFHFKNLAIEDIFDLNYFVFIKSPEGTATKLGEHYYTNGDLLANTNITFDNLINQTKAMITHASIKGQKSIFKVFSKELKGAIPKALNIEYLIYSRYIQDLTNQAILKQQKEAMGKIVSKGRERFVTNRELGYKSQLSEFELLRIPLVTQVDTNIKLPVVDKWFLQVMCKPNVKRKKPKKLTKTQEKSFLTKEDLMKAKESLKAFNLTQNIKIKYSLSFQIAYVIQVREPVSTNGQTQYMYNTLRVGKAKSGDILSLKDKFSSIFQRENKLIEEELAKFYVYYKARKTVDGYDVQSIKIKNKELETERYLQEIGDSCIGAVISIVPNDEEANTSFVISLPNGEELYRVSERRELSVGNIDKIKEKLIKKAHSELIQNNGISDFIDKLPKTLDESEELGDNSLDETIDDNDGDNED